MEAEKQFSFQEWIEKWLNFILLQNQSFLSRGYFVENSQGGNPTLQHHQKLIQKEMLAVWQRPTRRPTVMHIGLPEHQHAFRTLKLVWNSRHEIPPDGCHRKWGFPGVLWWGSFVVTWNCFHTKCRFLRLKSRPTRINAVTFARVSANRSRTTAVSTPFFSVTGHISTWTGMVLSKTSGSGP